MADNVPTTPGGGKTTFSGPFFLYDSGDRVRVRAGSLPGVFWGFALAARESRVFIRDDKAPEGWAPL